MKAKAVNRATKAANHAHGNAPKSGKRRVAKANRRLAKALVKES